jgi:type II secretory pathway component GspD/PulD (secretin)
MRRLSCCFLATFVLCAAFAAGHAQSGGRFGPVLEKTPKKAPPPIKGEAFLQIYPAPGGQAEGLAKLFQEIYKDSPSVRISPLGTHQIAVWAGPDVHLELARQRPLAPAFSEVVSLTTVDADRIAETVRASLRDLKGGAPFIEALPQRNALLIRGSAEQVKEARDLIHLVAGDSEATGNLRIITLDKANASVMADAVRELFAQMLRPNPVKVIVPARPGGEPPAKQEPAAKGGKPARGGAPITITAFGNRLIVTTDDPQAMALVVELTRLLQAPAGEGDFEVIRLKHAQAANIAQVLDDVFNGSRLAKGGLGGGSMGPGAGLARAERVRVVAEPNTNTLLIKASPLDVLTIRNLLSKALDIPEAANMRDPVPDGKKKMKKKDGGN